MTNLARRVRGGLGLGALRGGAVLLACCGVALSAAGETPPDRLGVDMMAAYGVARNVLADLREAGSPTPDDYALAQHLLRVATTLAPSDQTLLRLALEAASGAGDSARASAISRELVRLDPLDTVATLRLVSANIAQMQTVDERLAAYDRLLGPDGEQLDPSVRSRLALDAALLVRERGDLEGFRERLGVALELDRTNKDAATLTLNLAVKDGRPADEQLDAALFVIDADPYDQEAYQAALSLLLENGAYAGAARVGLLSRRLYNLTGQSPGARERERLDLAEWNSSGPEPVIGRLSDMLSEARDRIKQRRALLERAGKPLDGIPRPEELRLPIGSDRVRAIAAAALGDRERASMFLGDLGASLKARGEELGDPSRRPEGSTEQDAALAVSNARAEIAWLSLWAGVRGEEAEAAAVEVKGDALVDQATRQLIDAWLRLRTRDAGAERALAELSRTDPRGLLGLAVLAEQAGDSSLALTRYRQVSERLAGSLEGAYARTRQAALSREVPEVSKTARDLDEIVRGIPEWLEGMLDNPRRVVSMEVAPLRREIRAWERTPMRVTIRNNAPALPLGMGPGRPIDTRLLFAPSVDLGNSRLPAGELVHVASIDRRLRLNPGESVEAIVWPDLGTLSSTLEILGSSQARVRWKVLQGFEMSPTRIYEACPWCLTAETAPLPRRPSSQFSSVSDAVKYSLQTRSGAELADSILSIVLKATTPDLPATMALTPNDADAMMEVLAKRFGSMEKGSKILVLSLLPTTTNFPAGVRVDQAASFDTDDDVLAVLLGTRTASKDDPAFSSTRINESPALKDIARLVRARIDAKRTGYAGAKLSAIQPLAPLPTLPDAAIIPLQLNPEPGALLLPIGPDPRPVPVFY
ncbi:MAG: hypothetical protein K2Q20_12830 [Phycisphaerales bacterium]|nr:hypothetical protein [Phycisphaerales bacterium]